MRLPHQATPAQSRILSRGQKDAHMDLTLLTPPNALLPLLGTAHAPALIDVCVPEDVDADPFRLPGAHRFAHMDVAQIAEHVPDDRPTVVICQKGLKLSQGVAAHLRARGRTAHALAGGAFGWANAHLPRTREGAAAQAYVLSPPCAAQSYLAVWLIRRWIAPKAAILWVSADTAADVADRFQAVHLVRGLEIKTLLQDTALTWEPLRTFLDIPHDWHVLLRAHERLHNTPDSAAEAALPVIDAAWTALRKDMS